jgi:putative IMPACT (imprinted ancient) family translation regulator
MASPDVFSLTVSKSRFYAVFAQISDEPELRRMLDARQKAVRKACHHCWAARYRNADGQLFETAHNDGEVGKPGHKMLDLLRRRELEGALVVSRIYGGVKLGPAGVGRAFVQAAMGALSGSA